MQRRSLLHAWRAARVSLAVARSSLLFFSSACRYAMDTAWSSSATRLSPQMTCSSGVCALLQSKLGLAGCASINRAWDARTFPMVGLTDALGRAEAISRRRLRLADHVADRKRYVPNPP